MTLNKLFKNPILHQEEKWTLIKDFKRELKLQEENKFRKVLDQLSASNIIQIEGEYIKFTFVGVLIIENSILYCYPKYFKKFDYYNFKKVIQVIKKTNRSGDRELVQTSLFSNDSLNNLSLILFFVEDYFENGLYQTTHDTIETNGHGKILWNKTIKNNLPIIKNDKPYYFEMFTKKRVDDYNNYFRLLHTIIVSECSKILRITHLDDLFGITTVPDLTDQTLVDFDELNHILKMIDKEKNVQFNTHKNELLDKMKQYLMSEDTFATDSSLNIYGTTSFEVIWEKLCKVVFGDKLDKPIRDLPIDLVSKYDKNKKLIKLIKEPIWFIDYKKTKGKPFIPDLITVYENNFLIFDAKYYNIKMNDDGVTGQPDLESITKQYMYELAYKEFINAHNLNVRNSFLFPVDGKTSINGYAKLEILENLNLQNIYVIFVSANDLFDCYLKNSKSHNKKWREQIFKKII